MPYEMGRDLDYYGKSQFCIGKSTTNRRCSSIFNSYLELQEDRSGEKTAGGKKHAHHFPESESTLYPAELSARPGTSFSSSSTSVFTIGGSSSASCHLPIVDGLSPRWGRGVGGWQVFWSEVGCFFEREVLNFLK